MSFSSHLRPASAPDKARPVANHGSASRRMDLTRCAVLAEELDTASRIHAIAWIDKLSVAAALPGRAARVADPYIEMLVAQLGAGVLLAPFAAPPPSDAPLPVMDAVGATHTRGNLGRSSSGHHLAQKQPQQHRWRAMHKGRSKAQQGDLLEKRLMSSVSSTPAKPAVPTELIAETARWVVQNGKDFEDMLKDANRDNPLWTFLLDPKSVPAQAYRDRLQHERRRRVTEKKAAAARERQEEHDAAKMSVLESRDRQFALRLRREERAKQRLKLEREEEMAHLVAHKKKEQAMTKRQQQEEQAKVAAERRQAEEIAAPQDAATKLRRQAEPPNEKQNCSEMQLATDVKSDRMDGTAESRDGTHAQQTEQAIIVNDEVKTLAMSEAIYSLIASPDKVFHPIKRSDILAEKEPEEKAWNESLDTDDESPHEGEFYTNTVNTIRLGSTTPQPPEGIPEQADNRLAGNCIDMEAGDIGTHTLDPTVVVQCPSDSSAGDTIEISLESGSRFEIEVPQGVQAGDEFTVHLPSEPVLDEPPETNEIESVELQQTGDVKPQQQAATNLPEDELLKRRQFLLEVPQFCDFTQDTKFFDTLAQVLEVRTVKRKTVIVEKGSPGTEMFFIIRGEVEVLRDLETAAFATLGTGSFFGEASVLAGTPANAFVRTKRTVHLYALTKGCLLEVLKAFPDVAQSMQSVVDDRAKGRKKYNDACVTDAAEKERRIAVALDEDSLYATLNAELEAGSCSSKEVDDAWTMLSQQFDSVNA